MPCKGNLTTDPTSAKTYTYTSENQVASASGGVSVYYDPVGRLAEYDTAISTRFMSDGPELSVEVDNPAGAVLRRYVRGDGADELIVQYEGSGTAGRRFAGLDERGSVISLTDSAGTLIGINRAACPERRRRRRRRDEYGKPQSTNGGRMQYTGQAWLSELNAYHYKARAYLPHLGIFAQADPIGYGSGPNLYAYVLGDPVNLVDPVGLNDEGDDANKDDERLKLLCALGYVSSCPSVIITGERSPIIITGERLSNRAALLGNNSMTNIFGFPTTGGNGLAKPSKPPIMIICGVPGRPKCGPPSPPPPPKKPPPPPAPRDARYFLTCGGSVIGFIVVAGTATETVVGIGATVGAGMIAVGECM